MRAELLFFTGLIIIGSAMLGAGRASAYQPGDHVVLKTSAGCPACKEAKALLQQNNIPYTEEKPTSGYFVPQLYVNGHYKGYGTQTVESYIHA